MARDHHKIRHPSSIIMTHEAGSISRTTDVPRDVDGDGDARLSSSTMISSSSHIGGCVAALYSNDDEERVGDDDDARTDSGRDGHNGGGDFIGDVCEGDVNAASRRFFFKHDQSKIIIGQRWCDSLARRLHHRHPLLVSRYASEA